MADISTGRTSSSSPSPPKPSRLQRRRPASLQIYPPSSCWNTAIPLLSPLVTSPTAIDPMSEMKSREEQRQKPPSQHRIQEPDPEKSAATPVFKWQHPADSFCFETPSFAPKFYVPV